MDPEDVHNFGIKLNIYNPDEDEDPSDFKRVSKEETEKEEAEIELEEPEEFEDDLKFYDTDRDSV